MTSSFGGEFLQKCRRLEEGKDWERVEHGALTLTPKATEDGSKELDEK